MKPTRHSLPAYPGSLPPVPEEGRLTLDTAMAFSARISVASFHPYYPLVGDHTGSESS